MANRVLIQPGDFKVSKSGNNVLAVGESLLQFNANFAGGAKFLRGSVSGSRPGNGTTNHTVSFGKTFSAPPIVFIYSVNTTAGSPGGGYPNLGWQVRGIGDTRTPYNNYTFSWSRLEVNVGTSSVAFAMSSASSSFTYVIHYAILDYRFGF